uniref:TMV resistance protein N-like n=1 Tax=Erigeron canadensis TaxID=72917 RepID=UPI001CB99DD4|nr:TMV resistance protein N-like [Erigeron canadensis]
MTEVTMAGDLIVTTVVVILITTVLLVIVSNVFSRRRSRDMSSDSGGGAVPIIPDTSSSSSPLSQSWKYDVFLSFRGEDTRKTFVDHLYFALEKQGICTYKDDVTLDRGDTIGPSLLKAIESSQILVIVFSENYADSSWCLDELTHIMKCKGSERGQLVMPIFYHVDPSDVRKHKGTYGEAFLKHELSRKNKNKVETWKKALLDASNIAGWEPKQVANGHEAKCIQEIVGSISNKLTPLNPVVEDENHVGMGIRLEQLKLQLSIGSGGVLMVGIWGVGGGGKTTLATSFYMEFSLKFDGCCFLGNIREETRQHGLLSLQEKVLSAFVDKRQLMGVTSVDIGKHMIRSWLCRRNVLIVLDDVDHLEQIEALAGCHNWFGNGSRIIITTRDEQVLRSHRVCVDKVCPISLLSNDEAMQLFKKHAYHENDDHLEDFEELSIRVISYVKGLPLALKILGSFLYGKDKDEWISTLARLKDHPEMDIVEKLKISYDGLKNVEKELFLDIACFFRGKMKDDAMEILDACGFYPAIGVKVLIQKALITVSKDGKFDMHDLIQEMGHYIVRGKHPNNPEKHSRLWRKEDIEDICFYSSSVTTQNDKIEGIMIHDHVGSSSFITFVSNIKKLRFISVKEPVFIKAYGSRYGNSYGDEGPSFLSKELRYIYWDGYPASPLPESFQPTKLVALKMGRSFQKELWKGYKYLPCLKELQLVDASELLKTPDFGGLPCLQKLMLHSCISLEEIHQSLGNHPSVVSVNVSSCHKLTRFPSIVRMSKLKTLVILRCLALVEFPKIEAKMDNLVELSLEDVGIEVLPSSVGKYCTNLISLVLECSHKLQSIEGNFQALKCLENLIIHTTLLESSNKKHILYHLPRFLRKLNLSRCKLEDGDISSEIGELSELQELDLSYNCFTRLEFSLLQLTRLKLLQLNGCWNLVELPELPSSLAILLAEACDSLEAVIRDEIHRNCKWLCKVLIWGWRKKRNIIGGERLVETMLQGNAIESKCMILGVDGLEIPRGFEPRVVIGKRCRIQLPENWCNDFSGFLFCAASDDYIGPTISMKHGEKSVGGGSVMETGDSQDDYAYWEEDPTVGGEWYTWVAYIPFSLLRHTSWWNPTSTAIQMEITDDSIIAKRRKHIGGCGLKLVPKRSAAESSNDQQETTRTHSSSSSSPADDDDYNQCELHILHDSMSAFKCNISKKLLT